PGQIPIPLSGSHSGPGPGSTHRCAGRQGSRDPSQSSNGGESRVVRRVLGRKRRHRHQVSGLSCLFPVPRTHSNRRGSQPGDTGIAPIIGTPDWGNIEGL
ncbi:uncharacterized protein METZ01_LOCUS429125, partial [marine metagenome]